MGTCLTPIHIWSTLKQKHPLRLINPACEFLVQVLIMGEMEVLSSYCRKANYNYLPDISMTFSRESEHSVFFAPPLCSDFHLLINVLHLESSGNPLKCWHFHDSNKALQRTVFFQNSCQNLIRTRRTWLTLKWLNSSSLCSISLNLVPKTFFGPQCCQAWWHARTSLCSCNTIPSSREQVMVGHWPQGRDLSNHRETEPALDNIESISHLSAKPEPPN